MKTKSSTIKLAPGIAQCRTEANFVSHHPELLKDFIGRPVGDAVASRDTAAGYVFRMVESLYSDAGEPPSRDAVEAAMPVDALESQGLDDVIEIVHTPAKLSFDNRGSRVAFAAFVREILKYGAVAHLRNDLDMGRPVMDSLEEADTAVRSAMMAGRAAVFREPMDWRNSEPLEKVSTGLTFIDKFLGGGTVAGEVYGLLGPMGSCKTTMALQLTTEAALGFAADKPRGENGKFAAIVNYETDRSETLLRVFGYAGQVPRDRMESIPYAGLSTSANPARYEHELLARSLNYDDKAVRLGEQERLDEVVDLLNQHVGIFDMTGQSEHPEHGMGGIDEIAQHIESAMDNRSQQCGLIVVDYVGCMLRRQLMDTGYANVGNLRHEIGAAAMQAKLALARRFNCPVWLVHQLSGDAASKTSAAKLDHTDAAESGAFAENLDFAFVIGNPTKESRASFTCSKHRRRPPRPSTVIQILGRWGRVVEATGYGFHPRTGQIIPKNHLSALGL